MSVLEIDLMRMYNDPSRHYHGINHILNLLNLFHNNVCVEGLPQIKPFFSSCDIHYAILAHDCIYDGKRKDNEEASAQFLLNHPHTQKILTQISIDNVVEMVLASKHHTVPDNKRNGDLSIFLSLDLSELAASEEIFHRNSDLIRLEYLHVDDESFMKGRIKFFESFLEREYIYPNLYLESVWGDKARKNIESGIKLANSKF